LFLDITRRSINDQSCIHTNQAALLVETSADLVETSLDDSYVEIIAGTFALCDNIKRILAAKYFDPSDTGILLLDKWVFDYSWLWWTER